MAILIKTSGTTEEVTPAKGKNKKFTLEELQRHVGGYIELVRANGPLANSTLGDFRRRIIFVDEEGRLKNRPFNEVASKIAGQTIVGDMLICERGEG